MKTSIARIFTMAAVTALVLGVAPTAKASDKGCSNASLHGTFADRDTGFLTAPPAMAGPFNGVSTQTYDGNGAVTATGMVSLNGNIVSITSKGTYTVNQDCTGTYTVEISPIGLTAHGFFVLADNGNELHILVSDPGTSISCLARKLYPGKNI